MAIETVRKLLNEAERANTAIIAFECSDYNMAYAACAAAERVSKPVIVMLDTPLPATKRTMSAPVPLPGALEADGAFGFGQPGRRCIRTQLGHCYIVGAIRDGFRSVMFDGSNLPLGREPWPSPRGGGDGAHL
jgi:fructose/tagatose bisphosphate aldolase